MIMAPFSNVLQNIIIDRSKLNLNSVAINNLSSSYVLSPKHVVQLYCTALD